MACEFRDRRRIEFYETDMAGIVHFSNFFRFMESTEHAFFRSLGLSLHREDGNRMTGWARVRASCEYRVPLCYQDEIEIELQVREKTQSSLVYEFVFRRLSPSRPAAESDEPEREAARGSLQVVHVARERGEERMRSCAMPAEVDRAIEVASPSNPRSSRSQR